MAGERTELQAPAICTARRRGEMAARGQYVRVSILEAER